MEKHKTSPLLRCLQPTALLLNNTVFLSRHYQVIVAMQKFDVLKTNVGPPLWHTHFLINPCPFIVWGKGNLYFSSTCLRSQCFEYFYIMPLSQFAAALVWLTYFTCFWNLSCFLDSLVGLKRGPGWLITLSCSFFLFPLLPSNLN